MDFGGMVELRCLLCKNQYKTSKAQIKHRGKSRYCSMKCFREYKHKNYMKTRRIKKLKSSTLKKMLWIYFSKFIRQRDRGICISCGKVDDWKNTDAGHYVPKTAGLSIYFDERNVHCQCTGCNRFRHGNLSQYALALKRKYGEQILEEIDQKRRQIRKISAPEYESLITLYKNKIIEAGFTFK